MSEGRSENRLAVFLRNWMLPIALALGISLYIVYRFVPALHPHGHILQGIASEGQRFLVSMMLFFQFIKVSPRDLKPRRWHFGAIVFQIGGFALMTALAALSKGETARILAECAMLCIICPTASAAGVITDRLGGDLAGNVTYLIMANAAATLLIPMIIPLVNPSATLGFWAYVLRLAWKIFPILILPCLLAWLIRHLTPGLHRIMTLWAPASFYLWGLSLTMGMTLATRALAISRLGGWTIAGIVAVSLTAATVQFWTGRRLGRSGKDGSRKNSITAGQALGQKNNGFLIWLGYNYLTPVTSVAGGLYAIWQNLFNSWELRHIRK